MATKKIAAKNLTVGMTITGTRKREPIRKIDRLSVGKKWVTAWSEGDRDFLYVTPDTKVEVHAGER